MRSTAVVVVALSLFCSCLLPSGTRAFIPAGSPLANSARGEAPRRTAASGVAAAPVVASRPARSSGAMRMVDQDVLMAGGVALAGVICGAGLVAFTEAQGERTAQRGSISDTVRCLGLEARGGGRKEGGGVIYHVMMNGDARCFFFFSFAQPWRIHCAHCSYPRYCRFDLMWQCVN